MLSSEGKKGYFSLSAAKDIPLARIPVRTRMRAVRFIISSIRKEEVIVIVIVIVIVMVIVIVIVKNG